MRNLKRALSLLLSSTMVLGMLVMGSSAAGYQDVDASNVNQEAIEVLQTVGIMTGDQNGNFNPDGSITRNEMAVVMAHLLNLDYDYYRGTNPFTDVPEWAAPYVAACAAEGVVAGIGNGRFDPDGSVTREQTAVILFNYAQSKGYDVSARADLSVFPDAGSVSGWAQDALAWANASGLISGAVRGTQTILDPQGSASRAQVAMILMGYVEHVVNA